MRNYQGIKADMTQVSPSQKKAAFSRKVFAKIRSSATFDKLLKNIEHNIDSIDLDQKKLATDQLFKVLPYLLPRESSGSALVQINNNTLINGKGADKVLQTLDKYLDERVKKTLKLQQRNDDAVPQIPLKEVKTVKLKKMPANSPLNKESI